jgi:hypothetical protein
MRENKTKQITLVKAMPHGHHGESLISCFILSHHQQHLIKSV